MFQGWRDLGIYKNKTLPWSFWYWIYSHVAGQYFQEHALPDDFKQSKHPKITQFPLSDALRWVYYSVGAFGVVGNGFVVVVMSFSRPLRRRSANIIIINQSAIDGLASLFFIAVAVPYGGVLSWYVYIIIFMIEDDHVTVSFRQDQVGGPYFW